MCEENGEQKGRNGVQTTSGYKTGLFLQVRLEERGLTENPRPSIFFHSSLFYVHSLLIDTHVIHLLVSFSHGSSFCSHGYQFSIEALTCSRLVRREDKDSEYTLLFGYFLPTKKECSSSTDKLFSTRL